MLSTRILTAKSSASWESQNTNWSNHSIGTVQKLHPVILLNTRLTNPPIVITGTRGTTKRLTTIPVKLVLPTKKSKIGKVPRLAPKVGNPYSLRVFQGIKSDFYSFYSLKLDSQLRIVVWEHIALRLLGFLLVLQSLGETLNHRQENRDYNKALVQKHNSSVSISWPLSLGTEQVRKAQT